MKKFKIKCLPIAFAVVLIAMLLSLPAQAATVSYYLDQNNAGLSTDNYVQVTISDGARGNIDFQVDILAAVFPDPGSNFGMDKFYFNFDSVAVSENNIVDINMQSWNVNENKNAGGGFGKYDFELKGTGHSRTTMLSFSITGVGGDDPWTYASDPEFFAAHVGGFLDDSGVESAKFAGSTLVPIPGSVMLLGSGLLGLIAVRRRIKK